MTWNYRVVKTSTHTHLGTIVAYEIREVYYNKSGGVVAISEVAAPVYSDLEPDDFESGKNESDALNVLEQELHRFKQAIEKPIVDLDTLEFAEDDGE